MITKVMNIISYLLFFAPFIFLIVALLEGRKTPESHYSGYKRDNGEV